MGRLLPRTLLPVALACAAIAGCGGASTPPGALPHPASAFHDSIGVNTHIVYFDTAYGQWPRVVIALERLGVDHVRDGIYANPAPQWRSWNARYRQAVALAVANGIGFDFVTGHPGDATGTIPAVVHLAATGLRKATDSIEGPNEYDVDPPPDWTDRLRDDQQRLYSTVRRDRRLAGVPVLGPSFGAGGEGAVGDLSAFLDLGNIHPYTGGQPPYPQLIQVNLDDIAAVSGDRPVWATEAGFHNAVHATSGQPGVPEDVAAVYTLRTLLEHFAAGIRRTYLYELLDEKPDPAGTDPEQHFGLIRNDFVPKPAYWALANLIGLLGPDRPPARLERLSYRLDGGSGLRWLLLQRFDGAHLLVIWSESSLWDRDAKRRQNAPSQAVRVQLPRGDVARVHDPVSGRILGAASDSPVRLRVGADPLVLVITRR